MGWLGALKLVPWSEVLEAAPDLVRGARRLFRREQDLAAEAAAEAKAAENATPQPEPAEVMQARLQQLTAQVELLSQQQRDVAGLVESLSEHNARLVEAVQALKLRLRWLAAVSAALALGLVTLAVLIARA